MNLEQTKDFLVKVQRLRQTYALISGPGMGKTESMYQLAEMLMRATKKNWWCTPVVASNHESFDLTGFNVPMRKENGELGAQLTTPFWWEQIEKADGVENFCILLLDEYADCEMPTQKVLARIVNDRKVGNRPLPPGVWPLMAGNRRTDRTGVQRTSTMFQNRFGEIHINYDVDCHTNRMIVTGMHPVGLSFVKKEGVAVYKDAVPNDPGPFYTPRSFERCIANLAVLGEAEGLPPHRLPDTREATEVADGFIGSGAGAVFRKHLKYADEVPDLEDIVLKPDTTRVPDELAAQYITAFMVAQRAKEAQLDPVITYLNRLRTELQVVAMRTFVDRQNARGELPSLYTNKLFSKWATVHRNVIMMAR